eukprot:46670-Hanusia_phi.AAC.2
MKQSSITNIEFFCSLAQHVDKEDEGNEVRTRTRTRTRTKRRFCSSHRSHHSWTRALHRQLAHPHEAPDLRQDRTAVHPLQQQPRQVCVSHDLQHEVRWDLN